MASAASGARGRRCAAPRCEVRPSRAPCAAWQRRAARAHAPWLPCYLPPASLTPKPLTPNPALGWQRPHSEAALRFAQQGIPKGTWRMDHHTDGAAPMGLLGVPASPFCSWASARERACRVRGGWPRGSWAARRRQRARPCDAFRVPGTLGDASKPALGDRNIGTLCLWWRRRATRGLLARVGTHNSVLRVDGMRRDGLIGTCTALPPVRRM